MNCYVRWRQTKDELTIVYSIGIEKKNMSLPELLIQEETIEPN